MGRRHFLVPAAGNPIALSVFEWQDGPAFGLGDQAQEREQPAVAGPSGNRTQGVHSVIHAHALKHALARTGVVAALAVPLAAVTTGLLPGVAANALTVQTGTLSFTSDPGDYIGQGMTSSFGTANGDTLGVTAIGDDQGVEVSVNGAAGDWWFLDLAAPSGQTLAQGDYTGATRYPFNAATEPGLSFFGDGRGCNQDTGSFTIQDVSFGPEGYVQQLDATFVQHCEGGDPALHGEIHIQNPPPPPVLDLGLAVAVDGTASTLNGKATIHGTVTCNEPASVTVSGTATEVAHRELINGTFSTQVACKPGAAAAWTATATPTGDFPFQKGDAEVQATASATDPNYQQTVTAGQTAVVKLKKAATL
jgi:hypothetical protein